MTSQIIWTVLLGGMTTLVGLFGWSHKSLRTRMDGVELKVHDRPTDQEVRTLVLDKLEPYRVEYLSLSRRMDEVRHQQLELDKKMQRVLEICGRLQK